MAPGRDGERLIVSLDLVGELVAPLLDGLGVPVVPGVADPLEEQHREHVRLEVPRIDRATERVRGRPQRRFQTCLRHHGGITHDFDVLLSLAVSPVTVTIHCLSHRCDGDAEVPASRELSLIAWSGLEKEVPHRDVEHLRQIGEPFEQKTTTTVLEMDELIAADTRLERQGLLGEPALDA